MNVLAGRAFLMTRIKYGTGKLSSRGASTRVGGLELGLLKQGEGKQHQIEGLGL